MNEYANKPVISRFFVQVLMLSKLIEFHFQYWVNLTTIKLNWGIHNGSDVQRR
jgi:hypothetical protein